VYLHFTVHVENVARSDIFRVMETGLKDRKRVDGWEYQLTICLRVIFLFFSFL